MLGSAPRFCPMPPRRRLGCMRKTSPLLRPPCPSLEGLFAARPRFSSDVGQCVKPLHGVAQIHFSTTHVLGPMHFCLVRCRERSFRNLRKDGPFDAPNSRQKHQAPAPRTEAMNPGCVNLVHAHHLKVRNTLRKVSGGDMNDPEKGQSLPPRFDQPTAGSMVWKTA